MLLLSYHPCGWTLLIPPFPIGSHLRSGGLAAGETLSCWVYVGSLYWAPVRDPTAHHGLGHCVSVKPVGPSVGPYVCS